MTFALADGYEPDFDIDLGRGSEAEEELRLILGEVVAGHRVEVKRDDRAIDTGRIYLEFAQSPKDSDSFKPSGLKTTKAEIFAVRVGNTFLVAPTSAWRYVGNEYGRIAETTRGANPTKGVTVPLVDIVKRLNEGPF